MGDCQLGAAPFAAEVVLVLRSKTISLGIKENRKADEYLLWQFSGREAIRAAITSPLFLLYRGPGTENHGDRWNRQAFAALNDVIPAPTTPVTKAFQFI